MKNLTPIAYFAKSSCYYKDDENYVKSVMKPGIYNKIAKIDPTTPYTIARSLKTHFKDVTVVSGYNAIGIFVSPENSKTAFIEIYKLLKENGLENKLSKMDCLDENKNILKVWASNEFYSIKAPAWLGLKQDAKVEYLSR